MVVEPLNLHPRRYQRRFNPSQERCEFSQKPVVLTARALYAFFRGQSKGMAQSLLPLAARLALVNDRIPVEDRVEPVIEEFPSGFLLRPSGAMLCVNRSQNCVRAAGAVRISRDNTSRILSDFESQMKTHRAFRHASQHGLKRFLGTIPHILSVVIRVDTAEFVCGDERTARHYSDIVQNVSDA